MNIQIYGKIHYKGNAFKIATEIANKHLNITDIVETSKIPKITPQQKQQAEQLYSQYLEQNPNGNIEGFKNFVQGKHNSVKPGVEELFESNPELANAVYSKILTNSGLSAENLLSLLLKDNLIEKQCS